MHNKIEDIILDSVVESTKYFLKNDMSISVASVSSLTNYIFKEHFATVSFKGEINFLCIISFDTKLLNEMYKVFFTKELSKDETNEMMRELPKEIINIVAGLAILKFPHEYQDLELSIPFDTTKDSIERLLLDKYFVSKEIRTKAGSFCCMIVG